jgi:hypothetical protein
MIANPRSEKMNTISNKQKVTAIAAIGAAAVFGMLSFGNTAQAAITCQTLNAILGLTCCDRMLGSQLINVDHSCHENKKIILKRKPRIVIIRRKPPTIFLTEVPFPFAITREGGNSGNGGGNNGNGGEVKTGGDTGKGFHQ